MAMYLRRSQNSILLLLLRSSASATITQTRNLSNSTILYSHNHLCKSQTNHKAPTTRCLPAFDFFRQSTRGFAKGKNKSKDDSSGSAIEFVDIGPTVKATTNEQMDAAIVALSRDLAKIRSGRASSGMLDHIIVETGGVKLPLPRLAVVSVMDSKTLSVNPYDPNTLKELENAIVSSPLGLNPQVDGERLIASIPPLTKEHTQAMCKVVTKSCEDVKQSIRRARQKAMDTIKKAGSSFPKDDAKKLEKEIDELTKKFVKSAEGMCKAKGKEITEG